MLMPIVSMNKMAMNESVAATCCYKLVLAGSSNFTEVLHGGYVGDGYIESFAWDAKWSAIDKKLAESTKHDIKTPSQLADWQIYQDYEGTWWVMPGGNAKDTVNNTKVSGMGWYGAACTHDTALCGMKAQTVTWTKDQHWGATTAHSTVPTTTTFDKPHAAKQYAS
jgi:hypothetical protein